MTTLVKHIIDNNKANHVLNDRQLSRLLKGSDQRRYGQVNRAIKAGELIRVKRGIYVLPNSLRNEPIHPFALAQQLMPGSYITAESALSFYGWIPEAVRSVVSISTRKKSVSYQHEILGKYEFRCLTVKSGYFYQSVTRHKLQNQVALIAEPVRALMDFIHLRKIPWQGLDYLIEGLRIDEQELMSVPLLSITNLLNVYKGKRETQFIEELTKSLSL
jgi:hypothetical protein